MDTEDSAGWYRPATDTDTLYGPPSKPAGTGQVASPSASTVAGTLMFCHAPTTKQVGTLHIPHPSTHITVSRCTRPRTNSGGSERRVPMQAVHRQAAGAQPAAGHCELGPDIRANRRRLHRGQPWLLCTRTLTHSMSEAHYQDLGRGVP